ncbi:MAG: Bax inhibitor-1/YccA family protein [Thermomicrobiales bacterium]
MDATAQSVVVSSAPATARAAFIRRTYLHVAGAIVAFAGVEALLLQWEGATDVAETMTDGWNWLLVLLAFAMVGGVADRWARTGGSVGKQYLGLGLFIVAEAVLFLPIMIWARSVDEDAIAQAGVVTLLMAAGLTAVPFVTGADFSFLGGALVIGGLVAIGLIVASILIGFNLGLWFSLAMVAFASAAILYQTSAILRSYRTDQHVAAALALFAAVALLFWYVLRIVASSRR